MIGAADGANVLTNAVWADAPTNPAVTRAVDNCVLLAMIVLAMFEAVELIAVTVYETDTPTASRNGLR